MVQENLINLLLGEDKEKMTEKQVNILVAAMVLFSQNGYAATSTREIAQRAGVAEGTIFKHYATKKELMLCLSEMVIDRVMLPLIADGLEDLFAQAYQTLDEFMQALMANRVQLLAQGIPMLKLLIQEVPFQPEIREKMLANIKAIPLATLLERLQKQGLIIDVPAEVLVRLLLANFLGFLITRFMILPELFSDDIAVEIQYFTDYLVRGLSPIREV